MFLLSGYKYPTTGLCLYAIRVLKDYFQKDNEDDSSALITLKEFIIESLNHCFDEKDEQVFILMVRRSA